MTVSCVLALEWTTVGRLDSSEILRIRGGLLDLAGALRGSTLSDGLPRALTIVRCRRILDHMMELPTRTP